MIHNTFETEQQIVLMFLVKIDRSDQFEITDMDNSEEMDVLMKKIDPHTPAFMRIKDVWRLQWITAVEIAVDFKHAFCRDVTIQPYARSLWCLSKLTAGFQQHLVVLPSEFQCSPHDMQQYY